MSARESRWMVTPLRSPDIAHAAPSGVLCWLSLDGSTPVSGRSQALRPVCWVAKAAV